MRKLYLLLPGNIKGRDLLPDVMGHMEGKVAMK
jgi:hypothetical protein